MLESHRTPIPTRSRDGVTTARPTKAGMTIMVSVLWAVLKPRATRALSFWMREKRGSTVPWVLPPTKSAVIAIKRWATL